MPRIEFEVLGEARPKGSARAFMPKGARFPVVTSDNKSLRGWENTIRAKLQQVMPEIARPVRVEIWDAPLMVELRFHLPRPKSLPRRQVHHVKKPDLDKLARGAIDAMIGVVFHDDSQVVQILAHKEYATGAARLEVTVSVYEGALFVMEQQ